MKCPSCGFEQPDTRVDCEYCGLVFAKWRAKQEAVQKALEPKPPEVQEKALEAQSDLKDKPLSEKVETSSGSFPNPQRIFELLGALYLQRNAEGDWFYFPWGAFGHGFSVSDPALLRQVQRLETIFSLFQASCFSTLVLATLSTYFYQPEGANPWIWFLMAYLVFAYGLYAYHSGNLKRDLPLARRKFDQQQYMRKLGSCFAPVSLLSPESITLLSTLGAILAMNSTKLLFLVGESAEFVGWLWMSLSLVGFILFSYLFYFEKPSRP